MIRFVVALIFIGFSPLASAQAIQKCQDEEGKWHYGDHAAEECAARSQVTVIEGTGEEVKQIDPPPTKKELDAERRMQEKLAAEKKLELEQKKLDNRLLSTYDSAESIVITRDALLISIDSYIQTEQDYMQKLEQNLTQLEKAGAGDKQDAIELRQRIQEYADSINNRLAAREQVRAKYENELTRYRQLVGN